MNLIFLLITLLPVLSLAIEPITLSTFGAAVSAAAYYYYNHFYCQIVECCSKPWVHESPYLDFTDLYGQPLAVQVVADTIKRRHKLSKPLSFSFHGSTGIGKSHLSSLISKMIFSKGQESVFFHIFSVGYHFPNPLKALEYHDMLREIIRGNLTKCEKSVFIFDEFDKMPTEAVSAITPFLEPNGLVDGVKTGQALFIFISNLGDKAITSRAYELWKSGIHRSDFKLVDFESDIRQALQEVEGPFKDSDLAKKDLIDAYVPFLPLEKDHVRLCIDSDFWKFKHRSATPKEVEEILSEMTFSPEWNNLYVKTGCRKVTSLVLRKT